MVLMLFVNITNSSLIRMSNVHVLLWLVASTTVQGKFLFLFQIDTYSLNWNQIIFTGAVPLKERQKNVYDYSIAPTTPTTSTTTTQRIRYSIPPAEMGRDGRFYLICINCNFMQYFYLDQNLIFFYRTRTNSSDSSWWNRQWNSKISN